MKIIMFLGVLFLLLLIPWGPSQGIESLFALGLIFGTVGFYSSSSDPNLAKDIVSESGDLYIMEDDTPTGISTAVLDKSTPAAATLTPAVSPYWVADAKIGQIIVLQDNNSNAWEFVVADNAEGSLTIDLTSDVDGQNRSALFTTATSYSFRLWGEEKFLGYTEDGGDFEDKEDNKKFTRGLPRKQIRKDLLERMVTLETVVTTPGPGILKAAHNLKEETSATYFILHAGSNPAARPYYYIIIKNNNVNGKQRQLRGYYCQIRSNGKRKLGGGEKYESLPVIFEFNSDLYRDDEYDYYRCREVI